MLAVLTRHAVSLFSLFWMVLRRCVSEFSDAVSMDLLANFYRVYADGPAVGIHCVVSTSRAKNIPSQILDASLQTWFFQLSDVHDYSSHGIRGTNVPAAVPGALC